MVTSIESTNSLPTLPLKILKKKVRSFFYFFGPTSRHHTLHPVLRASLMSLLIATKDQDGVTPLIAAVKNGHRDVVKALLDHGVPHGPSLYF
jgi:hypothetical protein